MNHAILSFKFDGLFWPRSHGDEARKGGAPSLKPLAGLRRVSQILSPWRACDLNTLQTVNNRLALVWVQARYFF